jgi:hypothetical protein
MIHICCGLMKSTNRPETCVLEPHAKVGAVFVCRVMLIVELLETTPPWINAALSCARAVPHVTALAANNAKLRLAVFMKRSSAWSNRVSNEFVYFINF